MLGFYKNSYNQSKSDPWQWLTYFSYFEWPLHVSHEIGIQHNVARYKRYLVDGKPEIDWQPIGETALANADLAGVDNQIFSH